MRIGRKLALFFISSFAVISILLFLSSRYFLLDQFHVIDKERMDSEYKSLQDNIKENIDSIFFMSGDWAKWTYTYDFVKSKANSSEYKSYIAENMTPESLVNLTQDIIVYSKNKQIHYSTFFDKKKKVLEQVHLEFLNELKMNEVFFKKGKDFKGIFYSKIYGHIIFASRQVTLSDLSGAYHGRLFFAKRMNQEWINSKTTKYLSNYKVVSNKTPFKVGELIVDNSLLNNVVIADYFNHTGLKLTISSDRNTYNHGKKYTFQLFLIRSALILFILLFLYLFLNYLVIKPLVKMSEQLSKIDINNIKDVKDHLTEKSISSGLEIQVLIHSINSLLKRVGDDYGAMFTKNKLEAINTLTNGLAHEVNNPLAIISGLIYKIKAENKKEKYAEIPKFLDKMNNAVLRAANIIAKLREINLINVSPDSVKKINIKDELRRTVQSLKNDLLKNNISVFESFDHELIEFECNSIHLDQIILNILKNSIDHLKNLEGQGRWIRIHTIVDDQKIKIIIEDSGSIENDIIQKIFNPFFTTKDIGEGQGLGLGHALQIAHIYQGDLYIDTKSVNTKFVLELPVHISIIDK